LAGVAVALTVVQMLVAVSAAMLQVGLPMLASNRENMPPLAGLALRAQRAHYNMLESMLLWFVSVVGLALIFLQLV
jgi:uncharacterized MAPEG superfamily protein